MTTADRNAAAFKTDRERRRDALIGSSASLMGLDVDIDHADMDQVAAAVIALARLSDAMRPKVVKVMNEGWGYDQAWIEAGHRLTAAEFAPMPTSYGQRGALDVFAKTGAVTAGMAEEVNAHLSNHWQDPEATRRLRALDFYIASRAGIPAVA